MIKVYRVQESLARFAQQSILPPLFQQLHDLILHADDVEMLLSKTAQTLGEAFQSDACLLLTQHEGKSGVQVTGWSPQSLTFLDYELAIDIAEVLPAALQSGCLVVLSDIPSDSQSATLTPGTQALSQFCQALLERHKLFRAESALGLAICEEGNVNAGVILLRASTSAWTSAEMETFKALTDLVALALTQVNHIQHMQTLQQEIYLVKQYQDLSHQVLGNLHHALEQDKLLKLALNTTAQALQIDRSIMLSLKYENPTLKLSLSQAVPKAKVTVSGEWPERITPPTLANKSRDPLTKTWFWLSECQVCQQVMTGVPKTIALSDLHIASDFQCEHAAEIFDLKKFSALLVTPLLAPANSPVPVLGFWVLQHCSPRSWSRAERDFIESVAALISAVIIHNQALRQVQSLGEERSNPSLQEKLYKIKQQQVEQLQQLNQLKDEFLDTLSHELRTPLTSMKLAITMLSQPGMVNERASKYLDVLEREWTREHNLIKDLLLLQELESSQNPSPLCNTSLTALVQDIVPVFEKQWAAKGLNLVTNFASALPNLQSDPQSLRRIVHELLTNAGKFSQPNGTIQFQIAHQATETQDEIVLALINQGLGVAPNEQAVIFEKFRRGQGVTQKAIPGVGLGLALVKCLVKQLQGSIEVSSHPLAQNNQIWETCFTVRLPLAPSPEIQD
jgi:signal transduction histidine kinase